MSFQDKEIDEEFELLVLVSDGLWDVVPNEVSLLFVNTGKITHHITGYEHISPLQ